MPLCLIACRNACGGCCGQIDRSHVMPDHDWRGLVRGPDGTELLAGEIGSGNVAVAIRTRQQLLIDLTSCYIRHSIAFDPCDSAII